VKWKLVPLLWLLCQFTCWNISFGTGITKVAEICKSYSCLWTPDAIYTLIHFVSNKVWWICDVMCCQRNPYTSSALRRILRFYETECCDAVQLDAETWTLIFILCLLAFPLTVYSKDPLCVLKIPSVYMDCFRNWKKMCFLLLHAGAFSFCLYEAVTSSVLKSYTTIGCIKFLIIFSIADVTYTETSL
jgi:hypothetical protein